MMCLQSRRGVRMKDQSEEARSKWAFEPIRPLPVPDIGWSDWSVVFPRMSARLDLPGLHRNDVGSIRPYGWQSLAGATGRAPELHLAAARDRRSPLTPHPSRRTKT